MTKKPALYLKINAPENRSKWTATTISKIELQSHRKRSLPRSFSKQLYDSEKKWNKKIVPKKKKNMRTDNTFSKQKVAWLGMQSSCQAFQEKKPTTLEIIHHQAIFQFIHGLIFMHRVYNWDILRYNNNNHFSLLFLLSIKFSFNSEGIM